MNKTTTLMFKVEGFEITCTKNNIHIKDSYKVKSEIKMKIILEEILAETCREFKYRRSIDSWVKEWKAHNKLYEMNIARSHTADVDLNEDEKKSRLVIFNLLSYL